MIENKKQDFKIFLKYIFNIDINEIKNTLKKPATYSNIILTVTTIYLFIKIIISLTKGIKPLISIEAIIICILILIALILQLWSTYKSGAHRYWYKKSLEGIKQEVNIEADNLPVNSEISASDNQEKMVEK